MKKVLVVEDDKNLAELLTIHLTDMECQVSWQSNGKDGVVAALNELYDLIILDVMLPGMSGLDICKRIRAEKVNTPILMLTAKSEEIDKVLGLESGADDYITKPFSIREFIARIRAIFRRTKLSSTQNEETSQTIYSGGLVADLQRRIVTLNDERVELTPKEFDLLEVMIKHKGETFSRERLLRLVWGVKFEGYEHTVNSHINRLRAKIEHDMSKPSYILTTWGVGYRFNDEL